VRAALSAAAPEDRANPRVVVLTPGIGHPSYFEHSYLASYLGYNLVEGADLAVRDGRVWLRALGGMEPVDALLRRMEEAAADPLELEPDAPRGVPGLVAAARERGVAVANALGSAIAGHLGLQAYLPALCEHLLGERLRLASLPTLWCGDTEQRAVVLSGFDRMVLHDTDPVAPVPAVFAGDLADADAEEWRRRIERTPHRYVAHEKADFATTPPSGGAWRSCVTSAAALNPAAERRIAPTLCGSVTWSSTTIGRAGSPSSTSSRCRSSRGRHSSTNP